RLAEVVRAAVAASGRRTTGVLGPYDQARAAAEALGAREAAHEGRELLYALDLRALRIPEALASNRVRWRRPREPELPLLTDWRADYVLEAQVEDPGPDLRARCAVAIELLHADGADFVLEEAGAPVAYCRYTGRIAEGVQIRGRGTPAPPRARR